MAKPLEDRIRTWNEKLEKVLRKKQKLDEKEGHIRTKLQHLEIKRSLREQKT